MLLKLGQNSYIFSKDLGIKYENKIQKWEEKFMGDQLDISIISLPKLLQNQEKTQAKFVNADIVVTTITKISVKIFLFILEIQISSTFHILVFSNFVFNNVFLSFTDTHSIVWTVLDWWL